MWRGILKLVTVLGPRLLHWVNVSHAGAFYYMLGNLRPMFRSRTSIIQLLILAKYNEFGIDRILEPCIEDIKKLESVG